MTHAWRLAWRSLRRNRRRNLATGLAVLLGYAGLVLLGGYAVRIESFLRNNAVYLQHLGHVAVYHRGGLEQGASRPAAHSLTIDEQDAVLALLRDDERVEFTGRYLRGQGLIGNGCRSGPFVATGIEPAVERRILAHPLVTRELGEFARPIRGRALSQAADVDGAIGLSAGLARLMQKPKIHDEVPPGQRIVVPICDAAEAEAQIAADANVQLAGMNFDRSLSAMDGEIVNVFHTASTELEDQTVYATLEGLQRLYATDQVTYVAAFLHRAGDAAEVARSLREAAARRGLEVDVYTYEDYDVNPYYVGTMQFLGSLVLFIGLLVVSVVVLGVLNAATLTVFERTRELGTLRALGYNRRQIAALFVREVTLLALVATGVGLVLAFTVAAIVNRADIRLTPPGVPGSIQLLLTPNAAVSLVVAVAMLPLSLLATWLVVRRRLRERVADLLTATTA